jgi:polar amino acid transport system substrate-binding protein
MLNRWLLALMLAWTCLPALADKMPAPACPARPIVVGLYEFGNFYRAGAGLDKDLAEELRKRSGCIFSYKVMQRRAIWPALQSGSVDMTFSAAATPERMVFAWAEPYMWVRNMLVLRKEGSGGVHSLADFIADPNLRLGHGRAYAAGPPFEDFVAQLRNIGRVEDVDDSDRLYAMFKAGRFQALLAPKLVYGSYLKDEIAAGTVRVEDWGAARQNIPTNLMMAKVRFSAEESRRWGALLKEMRADGTLLRMIARYVGPEDAGRMLAQLP